MTCLCKELQCQNHDTCDTLISNLFDHRQTEVLISKKGTQIDTQKTHLGDLDSLPSNVPVNAPFQEKFYKFKKGVEVV